IKKVRKTINELKTIKERINHHNIDDLINKINSLEIYALEGKLFKERLSLYTNPKEDDYKELFKALTKNLKIISRAEPEVKLLFLEGLKKLEKSVAVTGRLVTDEKYLKKANVGFSLELRGNDITKEASDIILLSDSLDGILMSYKYSKMFYNKLRILLLFYVPFISVLNIFMLFGIFLLRENTFTPLKILWINIVFSYFIMPILTNVLKSKKIKLYKLTKPNGKIPLINSQLIISMIFQFLHQLFFLILMIWVGEMILGIVPSNININTVSQKDIKDLGGYNITVIFNVFVYMQIFSFISANGVINTLFDFNSIVGILWLIGGQIIIGFLGEKYFDIKVIGLKDHFICLFISSLSLPVNFISSIFPIEDKIEEEKVKKERHPLGKEKVE
ncbi:MAG: cation transporting ATPase C-terminal domain-containing protein, partial [archaeon]|nr:cation transporting ATPase C-terminal domain-containing protein [archaeon]